MTPILIIGILLAVAYVLFVRPAQKRSRSHTAMQTAVVVGVQSEALNGALGTLHVVTTRGGSIFEDETLLPVQYADFAIWQRRWLAGARLEHEVRYSWLLPTVRYVFRADYDRPHRIDFRRISGDLKEEEGTWLFTPTADGAATVVEYEVYVDPGFWIPQALVAHTLRRDIPAVLTGLRECVERDAGPRAEVAKHVSPGAAHLNLKVADGEFLADDRA